MGKKGGKQTPADSRQVKVPRTKHRQRSWPIIMASVSALLVAVIVGAILRSYPGSAATPDPSNMPAAMTQAGRRMRAELKAQREVVVGNQTFHPSFGIFPRGCKWRTVTTKKSGISSTFEGAATDVTYQFWVNNKWVDERPKACTPTGFSKEEAPPDFKWYANTPRTEVVCDHNHCVYHNLYYNNGRWYAIVDGARHIDSWRFSRNQEVVTMHVTDAYDFIDSVKWRVIPGDTILFDFIFFTHPTAIGHWWEMLGPMYSSLKVAGFKRPCDQFILLHLQRQHLFEWVRAMIAVTLGVGINAELPPVYLQEPSNSAWTQLTQMLQGFDRDTWYIFSNVAIAKDLYTGGMRTFRSRTDAREFRALVYQHYGLPPPSIRPAIPRLITFQRKRANRRILNEDELIALLRTYGELQVVEYSSSSSLYEQLLQMSRTGIYVSVHTSNLANAPLLQPGSAVFELLHRNWHWNGLDTSFKDQTLTMGDIHHFAWRAQYLNQTVYLDDRDRAKVAHWPASQCGTEECVEAHTRVDVVIDIQGVKELLDSRLPEVWAGTPVVKAEIPWPRALDIREDNLIPGTDIHVVSA